MMVVFLITGAIAGIMLGLRFKVLVLIPAILVATVVIIVNGSGDKLSVIVLTVVGTAASLQIGYVVGCILRVLARAYLPTRTTDAAGRKKAR
jgi:membrane-anchored glycerophosphoryl diester phosphodiesterase (GDPDase)